MNYFFIIFYETTKLYQQMDLVCFSFISASQFVLGSFLRKAVCTYSLFELTNLCITSRDTAIKKRIREFFNMYS